GSAVDGAPEAGAAATETPDMVATPTGAAGVVARVTPPALPPGLPGRPPSSGDGAAGGLARGDLAAPAGPQPPAVMPTWTLVRFLGASTVLGLCLGILRAVTYR